MQPVTRRPDGAFGDEQPPPPGRDGESLRLLEDSQRRKNWKRWGPYLAERAWGTVREDYSPDGSAWTYFPHDHARSRAYRWGEDGIAGLCDRHQYVCLAIALWKRPAAEVDGDLRAQLALQSAELRRLADAAAQRELTAEQLRQGLDGARRSLQELHVRDQERRATDGEQREVVRRLATVLAGGASKGRAGEHVLREHLSQLPPGMLTSDFRVNGKVVEFGLVLPDGRRLPIDSK